MRVIFAGTPEFARSALAALHAAGHDMVGVFTQPDRPAGRGMKLQASAVKQFDLSKYWKNPAAAARNEAMNALSDLRKPQRPIGL